MTEISLPRGRWRFDEDRLLGAAGGFGAVYAGTAEDGRAVAVKRLHLSAEDAAHRELRIAALLSDMTFEHVIPVFDAGRDEDTDSYFVVMAKAEKSLADDLPEGGTVPETEAVQILLSIALGLSEVEGLVHRDLKPANVLFHDGTWKIADFGIARFVEEATSSQTLKSFLTPPYSAPEQFELDRATNATDIYALGCIAHALLAGRPPFPGPGLEDFARQHSSEMPPAIDTASPRLRALAANMLKKTPGSRPSIERVERVLRDIQTAAEGRGPSALEKFAAEQADREAKKEAERSDDLLVFKERAALAEEGAKTLREMALQLGARIEAILDAAVVEIPEEPFVFNRSGNDGRYKILVKVVGSSTLDVEIPTYPKVVTLDQWLVVADGSICVADRGQETIAYAYLCYTDAGQGGGFRWWEVRMRKPCWRCFDRGKREDRWRIERSLRGEVDEIVPKDRLQPDYTKPWPAHEEGLSYRLAAEPQPIDDEDFEDFCERWMDAAAAAAKSGPSWLSL